jgi:hypothetical protein
MCIAVWQAGRSAAPVPPVPSPEAEQTTWPPGHCNALACCSSGEVVATGSFQTADVATSGISTVYLSGVSQAVNLELGGITDLYLQPAYDSVQINGRWAVRYYIAAMRPEPTAHSDGIASKVTCACSSSCIAHPPNRPCRATGISTIRYTHGQCNVQSAFLLSSPCQQSNGITLQVPTPTWTQGLSAFGSFSCALGKYCSLPICAAAQLSRQRGCCSSSPPTCSPAPVACSKLAGSQQLITGQQLSTEKPRPPLPSGLLLCCRHWLLGPPTSAAAHPSLPVPLLWPAAGPHFSAHLRPSGACPHTGAPCPRPRPRSCPHSRRCCCGA